MKLVAYIFPHHDDEIFSIPKLNLDISSGNLIKVFYLTSSPKRLSESISFLRRFELDDSCIHTLNIKYRISDGHVVEKLSEIFFEICSHLNAEMEIEFVTTAYEGGHQDHDAASLLSRALAQKFNAVLYEFYLYNGHKTFGRFYKVSSPMSYGELKLIPWKWSDILLLLITPFIFNSQKMAFLGLWPFLFVKALFLPLRLTVSKLDSFKVQHHLETPMYERWNRTTHNKFLTSAREHKILSSILR